MRSLLIPFLLITAVFSLVSGFLSFADTVAAMKEPDFSKGLPPAEAIVVLTGGSERVATGVELLRTGNGQKLFISGVHKNLSAERLVKSLSVPDDLRECCIVLGYKAVSTAGNAKETRDWIAKEKFKSMHLVTANYHMPRSMLVFRAAMPDIAIVPFPVSPENVKLADWWAHPGTISLLVTEYGKYLIAGLSIWINSNLL
ncbi:MAG: YdcF family protein [Alphaproteobacteria bacterium]|nr:YdcF family protein [Alphaproteobacteria bacterium]